MQAGKLEILNISDILPNRFQPRFKFDDEALNQLAVSIARFGVIEPIVVRPTGKKYEIIAGERRFKASKLAGKSTIPCMIVNLSDKDSEELALLENVQRKELSPIEEAVSYKKILDSGYITRDELSKKIGKPQSLIFSKIKLLELSDEVQNYLLNNKISERHARSLLQLETIGEQNEMLHRIVNERLTVKATDREIDKILKDKRNIKTSNNDTESLFDDERGKEKMDIDKIMQEAKDINVQETPNVLQAPNLMASGMDKPSELLGGQENVPVNEPGKFVSVSQPAPTSSPAPMPTPAGVTFDNMFTAPIDNKPIDSQSFGVENVKNGAIVSNSAIDDNIPNLNSLMTGVTPLMQSSLSPSPMNEPKLETNGSSFEASNSISEAAPISVESQPNVLQGSTPVFENSVNQNFNSNYGSSMFGSQPMMPSSQPVDSVQTVNSEVNNPALNLKTDSSAQTFGPEVNEINNTFQPTQTIPEVNVSSMNSISSDNVIPTSSSVSGNANINNAGQSISDAVSDAFKKVNNVPDVNIYQDSVSGFQPSNEVSTSAGVSNYVEEATNVPNYAKVVQMLRKCADDIQKNGYYVGIEEVDVDGKYKVIFTIDK